MGFKLVRLSSILVAFGCTPLRIVFVVVVTCKGQAKQKVFQCRAACNNSAQSGAKKSLPGSAYKASTAVRSSFFHSCTLQSKWSSVFNLVFNALRLELTENVADLQVVVSTLGGKVSDFSGFFHCIVIGDAKCVIMQAFARHKSFIEYISWS